MPTPEPAEHQKRRANVRSLAQKVAAFQGFHLDKSSQDIPNIEFGSMVLDEKSPLGPSFFAPYPAHLLPDPTDELDQETDFEYWTFDPPDGEPEENRKPRDGARSIDHYFSHYVGECFYVYFDNKEAERIVWSSISIGDPPFTKLGQYNIDDGDFGPTELVQVEDGSVPHIKAVIYNNLNGNNNEILRGELFIATRLMVGQMRRARFFSHLIFPVLLFSFMGPQHARLVEVHFNGHSLIVRATQLYDLREKDEAAYRSFAQWFLGKPIGDTKL